MKHQYKMCYATLKAHIFTHKICQWVAQVAQVIQVFQVVHVLQMVQVFMVVKVVQGVHIVQVISLNDLHPENMWSTWSKPSNYCEKLRCQACTIIRNCVYSSCYIF